MRSIWLLLGLAILLASCNTNTAEDKMLLKTDSAVITSDVMISNSKSSEPKTYPNLFSSFEITNIATENNEVIIEGTTDLPDETIISVNLYVGGGIGSPDYVGVERKTSVKDGVFKQALVPPQKEAFKNGKYKISIFFTPRNQNEFVTSIVGKNGEKLTGELVEDSQFGFKMMELIQDANLDLQISPPVYIFEKPDQYVVGSPQRTLAEFVGAWKNQDWDRMAKYSQITWKSNEKNPQEALKNFYQIKEIKSFIITNQNVSDASASVTFEADFEVGSELKKEKITAKIIKESDAYTPDANGTWGVNPISTLRAEPI